MSLIDYEINKELGECYLFMGEFDKARDYYMKAIGFEGKQPEPYLGLAAIALHQSKMDEAYTLYGKSYSVSPSDKSLTGLGMIEVEMGRYDDAFGHFAEALSHNPGNMMVLNSMLQVAYVQNRLEEMLPHLEAAVEPGDGEAVRYALAACLHSLGRDSEAKKHLEQLLGDNPANTEAKQLYDCFAA